MNSSRWFFSFRHTIYRVGVGVGGAPGGPRGRGRALGGRRAPTLVARVWAPGLDLLPVFFIIFKNNLREVSGHSENFCFCTKITPWQFCRKHRQSGLVPFKSCKLESKTRAKVVAKVDTMETYQLPQA